MAVKKLAVFDVMELKKTFSIYGDYKISTCKDCDKAEYKYPEFYDLTAKQSVEGLETDYQPAGETWHGRKYDVEDMIREFLEALIRNATGYSKIYLDPVLQEIVDWYLADDNIAVTVDNLKIPKRILATGMYYEFELALVTDEFIYYEFYDELIMLDAKTHEIVSDNYFASVGYDDSIENITSGKETLIYGHIC